jgi:hypothetical protein
VVFMCLSVQVFRCSSVQVFRCSGVQVFWCSGIPVFKYSSVLGVAIRSFVPMSPCPIQVCRERPAQRRQAAMIVFASFSPFLPFTHAPYHSLSPCLIFHVSLAHSGLS